MKRKLPVFSSDPDYKNSRKTATKPLHKGGGLYFGAISFVLFGMLFFGSGTLAQLDDGGVITLNTLAHGGPMDNEDLYVTQSGAQTMETPDLKIADNFVHGVATPAAYSPQTLGAIMGGPAAVDTHGHSEDEGPSYTVKSGDTVSAIAKAYKAKVEEIVAFNELVDEGDLFIGDVIIIPGGIKPVKLPVIVEAPLASTFFIMPAEGVITQGLHGPNNAVDEANKCGTPVYAAAKGMVQRAKYGWNGGGGNFVTVKHSNGVVTYYGHLSSISVKSGEEVEVGQRVGLMGTTGKSTGCHLHFGVTGAKNPLAKYLVGATISYK